MLIGMIRAEETTWEGTKWGGMRVRVVKQHGLATERSYHLEAFGKKNFASEARPGRGGTGTSDRIAIVRAGESDQSPRRHKVGPWRRRRVETWRRRRWVESRGRCRVP